jgi:hypothetical protein
VLRGGKPAVAVVTEAFANLAATAAAARGVAPLPVLVLPHPMETHPAEEIDRIAEERFEEMIRHLIAGEDPGRDG